MPVVDYTPYTYFYREAQKAQEKAQPSFGEAFLQELLQTVSDKMQRDEMMKERFAMTLEMAKAKSLIDQQIELQEYARKQQEGFALIEQVKKSPDITDAQKEQVILQIRANMAGIGSGIGGAFTEGRKSGPFTDMNIQQGLGELMTGISELDFLATEQDYIDYATRRWGPSWRQIVPQAEQLIRQKFPPPAPQSLAEPYTQQALQGGIISPRTAQVIERTPSFLVQPGKRPAPPLGGPLRQDLQEALSLIGPENKDRLFAIWERIDDENRKYLLLALYQGHSLDAIEEAVGLK